MLCSVAQLVASEFPSYSYRFLFEFKDLLEYQHISNIMIIYSRENGYII